MPPESRNSPAIYDFTPTGAALFDGPQQSASANLHADAYRDRVAFIKTIDGKNPDGTDATTAGTGFFATKDGALVTSYHVVRNQQRGIIVTTADGVMHRARLVDVDQATDLALLKVEPAVRGETFVPVELAPNSNVAPDERLFTRGHPRRSIESQVVSGADNQVRSLSDFRLRDGLMPGEDINRRVLTTAMTVDTGNSGGPLARESDGKTVGVVFLTDTKGQYTISTPVEDLNRFLSRNGINTAHNAGSLDTNFAAQPLAARLAPLKSDQHYFNWSTAIAPPGTAPRSVTTANPLIDKFSNITTLPPLQRRLLGN